MGILSGNPKNEPLHYGEVFGIWTHLSMKKAAVAGYQTKLNHVGDRDLHKFIVDKIEFSKECSDEMEKILKEHGVALPPTPPERAEADLESIPPGARFNDNEIAMALSVDIAAGLVACSTMMGQAIREDVAAMFLRFHTQSAAYGLRLLRLNKEKGWLVPPPLHLGTKE